MTEFLIRKFDFKTPGREEDTEETRLYGKADVNAKREALAETETEDPEAANPDAMVLEAGEDLVNVTIRVCGADRTTEIYRLDTAVYAPADR